MKTVFNTDMLIHVWANQSQTFGKRPSGSLRFDGPELIHYGGIAAYHAGDTVIYDYRQCIHTGWNAGNLFWAIKQAFTSQTVFIAAPRLSEISWELHQLIGIARDRKFLGHMPPKDQKDRVDLCRKRLRVYVADHVKSLEPEAIAYFLKLAKVRNVDGFIAAARLKLEKKAVKEKRTQAKLAHKPILDFAKELARVSEQDFTLFLSDLFSEAHAAKISKESWYSFYTVQSFASKVHAAHHAAKSEKSVKLVSAVWAKVKAFRAYRELESRRENRRQANKFLRDAISVYRETLANESPDSSDLKAGIYKGEMICDSSRVSNPVKEKIKAQNLAWTATREGLLKKEAAKLFEKQQAQRVVWLAGESNNAYGLRDELGGPLLRAVKVERDSAGVIIAGELQTSQGATVPLTHAIKVFQFVKLCRVNCKTWERNGHTVRVGHFTVDRIESNGDLTAGCHNIKWGEVERVAKALGVFEIDASDSARISSHKES